MKRLVMQVCILLGIAFSILTLMGGIVLVIPSQFEDSYTYCIQRKVKTLEEKREAGVIIVGDSSAAFGIDNVLLSELLDRPVVNLGLQGGMGTEILMNMASEYCVEGDIIVYASNNIYWSSDLGTEASKSYETIETGFDGAPELYRFIPCRDIGKMITAFPAFSCKKIDRLLEGKEKELASGAYAITSFDLEGNMILEREEWTPIETFQESWVAPLTAEEINPVCIEQLSAYDAQLSARGGRLLISYGPILDTCVGASDEELKEFQMKLESSINVPIISDIEDYIYSIDYFYNSPYHCNDAGCERRTRQLAADIAVYLE